VFTETASGFQLSLFVRGHCDTSTLLGHTALHFITYFRGYVT